MTDRLVFFGLCCLACLAAPDPSGFAKKPLPFSPASADVPEVREVPAWDTIRHLEKSYANQVEPVLKKWCFSCHSETKRRLWWQKLPLLKDLSEKTMQDAREALNLTMGFPFVGLRSIPSDLIRIRDSLKEKRMPPSWWNMVSGFRYLREEDTEKILSWTSTGLEMLKAPADG